MDGGSPIGRFDPLLRDLLAFNLVVRTSAARRGGWRLAEAVQLRLDELIGSSSPVSAERMVYLDHFCADCGLRVRTRLHSGFYLCEDCLACRTSAPSVDPESGEVVKGKRRWHRGRKESTPIAG